MIKHDEVVDKTIAEINGKPFFVYRGIEEGWQPIKSFRAEFWEELSTPRWFVLYCHDRISSRSGSTNRADV